MDAKDRKAAVAAYKERPRAHGVYAVICSATGETWVGRSPNVDTHRNGLWFSLKQGRYPNPALQAAWTQHGEGEFRFEELERLRADFPETGRQDELKRRAALWQARLRAAVL